MIDLTREGFLFVLKCLQCQRCQGRSSVVSDVDEKGSSSFIHIPRRSVKSTLGSFPARASMSAFYLSPRAHQPS